jgi:hypothetical protein
MEPFAVDAARYPVAIFGKLPAGFDLKKQQIQMLVFWLRKAMKVIKDLVDPSDAHMAAALAPANELLISIKGFEAKRASEIALQMSAIVEWLEFVEEDCIEVELDLDGFKHLTKCLVAAAAPLSPKKKTGPLCRGRKLTRHGLVSRYQAFLIKELETIGWHVYGERDYPMTSRPSDDAVNDRCRTPNSRGRFPVFFNPEKLTARAKSVLKSLKIDTERNDDVPSRRGVAR